MGLFRRVFMQDVKSNEQRIRDASAPTRVQQGTYGRSNAPVIAEKNPKYSGLPSIPIDIGYASSNSTSGKVTKGGTNPAVIVGMGLTTIALLGMFRASLAGDKISAQRYMRYRIVAQFFTVTMMCAGVAFFGTTFAKKTGQSQ